MNEEKHIAIVTGANRGLGFEISRQLAKQGLVNRQITELIEMKFTY